MAKEVGINTAFERCPAPSVESMLETLVVTGPNEIHINTYLDHPEGFHRTLTSFDVWVPRGRGFPIGFDKGERVRKIVFNDPGLPIIEWAIWQRKIRRRSQNYEPRPFGDNKFEFHNDHLHFTFLR